MADTDFRGSTQTPRCIFMHRGIDHCWSVMYRNLALLHTQATALRPFGSGAVLFYTVTKSSTGPFKIFAAFSSTPPASRKSIPRDSAFQDTRAAVFQSTRRVFQCPRRSTPSIVRAIQKERRADNQSLLRKTAVIERSVEHQDSKGHRRATA